MSNKLIKINKNFTPTTNFWDENPQLIVMKPFSELYNRDKSKGKDNSSREMWCMFFICDPDEDENKFYRIPLEERKQMLKETYYENINYGDELFQFCVEQYPHVCLSALERTLKEQKEHLIKRSKALTTLDYTLETMKEIDNAYARNLKINEDFHKVETLFNNSKKEQTARGGRKLTMAERGLL